MPWVNNGHKKGLNKVLELRDCNHRIRRQISRQNVDLNFLLAQIRKFSLLAYCYGGQ